MASWPNPTTSLRTPPWRAESRNSPVHSQNFLGSERSLPFFCSRSNLDRGLGLGQPPASDFGRIYLKKLHRYQQITLAKLLMAKEKHDGICRATCSCGR